MKPGWKGYQGKAESLLGWMKRGEISVRRDGPWMRVGDVPNVGTKMLVWMMQQGMIERRGDTRGMGVTAVMYDWYRIPAPDYADDLGDLWIE